VSEAKARGNEGKDGAGLEDILADLCFMILAGAASRAATDGAEVFAPTGLGLVSRGRDEHDDLATEVFEQGHR
jgi:hypothetical protein